jgi:beta-lactamase regulating signal transducer with metallopeptidase domain
VTNLGWAVLHSLWQTTAIGGATALVLALLRRRGPDVRARVAMIGLVLMVLAPALTACVDETTIGRQARRTIVMGLDPSIDLTAVVETLPTLVRAAAVAWAVGVMLAFAHLAVGWIRVRRIAAADAVPVEPSLRALVRDMVLSMRIGLDVEAYYSTRVAVPMVIGWRRPRILLPREAVTRLSASELRGVLAHELAHVRRNDYAANLAQSAIDRLMFFHPAVWWVSARVREEREYACDDAAIVVGRDAASYAHALAALEDARDVGRLAVAATSGTLLHRIQRLAGRSRRGLTPLGGVLVLTTSWVLAAVMFALLIMTPPFLPPGSKLRRRTPIAGSTAPLPRGAARTSSIR